MVRLCSSCSNYTNCTKPCERLEKQLERESGKRVERLLPGSKKGDNNKGIERNSRRVDLSRLYQENVTPLEIDWHKSSPIESRGILLDKIQYKGLRECLDLVIRGRKIQKINSLNS